MLRSPLVLDGDFNSQVAIFMGQTSLNEMPIMLKTLVNKEAMFKTHLEFLRAGADIIRTNTYRASVYNLNHFVGIDLKDSASVITKAALVAHDAVEAYRYELYQNRKIKRRPSVVGFCGPYGASLGDGSEYTGSYGNNLSQNELEEWHEPRVRALLDAGVDMLALGSVPCGKEAAAFVELLQKKFPQSRAWITFYCYSERALADGTELRNIVKYCHRVLNNQMVAIGVSCVESSLVSPLFRIIQHAIYPSNIPLIACPDKTSYRFKDDFTVEIIDPKTSSWTPPISEWLNVGARIIGGCCSTVAHDIKYICSEVAKYNAKYNPSIDFNIVKTKL